MRSVSIGGRALAVATKPGLIGHGRDDPANLLLAERVVVAPGSTAVQLNCGSGLFGTVAAAVRGAKQVVLSDRNAIAVEAATRTLAANGVTNAAVYLGHGAAAFPDGVRANIVGFRIPPEKQALLQLLADAFALLEVGGQCALAGATDEGIKSAAVHLAALFGNVTVLGTQSGHRAVMAIKRSATPVDTSHVDPAAPRHDVFRALDVVLCGLPLQLFSRPGVFSWEHLDEATAILAGTMDVRDGEDVLDLGCGSGPLGLLAAHATPTGRVCLVDVDAEAVRCTQRAITAMGLANCRTLCSDVADAVRDERFDVVVSNPPFHVGKGTDLDVPTQFIRDAWQVLRPGGRLMLVANRTLPYERLIRETFGNLTTLHDGPRFKVLGAKRQPDDRAARAR